MTDRESYCLVSTRRRGSTVIVEVAGTLDMLSAPRLAGAIDEAQTAPLTALVIDLSRVVFLAAAGMQVLVDAHQTLHRQAGFAVVADGPATSRPLRLIGLTMLFTVRPTLDAALAAVEANIG